MGWDLTLAGLAAFTAGDARPNDNDFLPDPNTAAAMRQSAAKWGVAHQAGGAGPEAARSGAANTSAFYAPDRQPSSR